jgi:hypothetical protein
MVSSIQNLSGALPDQIDLASLNQTSGSQAAQDAGSSAAPPPPQPTVNDITNLSALSATLARAIAAASELSNFRPPLVASIKAQIAAGMYGPDLSSVAQAVSQGLSAL